MGRIDLVAEIEQQEREAERVQRRESRRRRRRVVLICITMVIVAGVLGVAGKLGLDEYRVYRSAQTAQEHLLEGTPEALAVATVALDRALEIKPDHTSSRAMLALALAQQAIDGDAELETVAAAVAEAVGTPEAAVSAGIVAVLRGDFAGADQAVSELELRGDNTVALTRTLAWVRAQVALSDLDDAAALAPAITEVEAALEGTSGWDRNHRVLATLYFRAGRVDEAQQQLAKGRTLRSTDMGLAVDDALYHAVLHRDLGSVEDASGQVLASEGVTALDRGRAELALAIARYRQEPEDKTRDELREAWSALGPGDPVARLLAMEVALTAGESKLAQAWLDEGVLPEVATEIHRAWIDLVEDRVAKSLKRCAELPQGHPRVAVVQGLALVEQRRWSEAQAWLERAHKTLPRRLVLEAASARVDAQLSNPAAAAERLEGLAKAHPTTPRAWTGLAEALTRADEEGAVPKVARKPLERALEQERFPAEAAFLLGQYHLARGKKNPAEVPKAIEKFRKAVEIREWEPRYREALGLLLADAGDRGEARDLLEGVGEAPTTTASALIRLATLTAAKAGSAGKPPPKSLQTWLGAAAQRGATNPELQRAQAEIALADPTQEGATRARAWLDPLLAKTPEDLDARLLHIEALRRLGDIEGARASLRAGFRKTKSSKEGRLYLAQAELEVGSGKKKRRAASLAYKGWRLASAEEHSANDLIDMARFVAARWLSIDNAGVARSVGRTLTSKVPYRSEAWVFRAEAQLAAKMPEDACKSADKAIAIDGKSIEAHLARADCKLALRERSAARASLEKAAELTEDPRRSKALRRRIRDLK